MNEIIENRQTVIRRKVLTLESVRAVARVLLAEYEGLAEDEKPKAQLTFTIRCDDGSSYQSEGIELLADDSVITQKRITNVTLSYFHYPTKSRVEVALRHGSIEGTITVTGSNRKWVAGMQDALSGLFQSFRPQNNPFEKYSKWIGFAAAMGIGSILVFLISLLSFEPPKEEDRQKYLWLTDALVAFPFLKYVIKYSLTWFVGMPWTSSLENRFSNLWPSIELQIGPEHLQTEKLRRNLLIQFSVLAVVPLLLAVIYDIAKAVVGH